MCDERIPKLISISKLCIIFIGHFKCQNSQCMGAAILLRHVIKIGVCDVTGACQQIMQTIGIGYR